MKKKYLWLIISSVLILAIVVGVTIAFLVSKSDIVSNTFTYGKVKITLTETDSEYFLLPGASVEKDPTVTVLKNSEDCWLFIKIEKQNDFDNYCSFVLDDGWALLLGHENIYYRHVLQSDHDQAFSIIDGNCVLVKDTVTEEQLNAITRYPNLKFTAYAVQNQGFSNVADAWTVFGGGGEE